MTTTSRPLRTPTVLRRWARPWSPRRLRRVRSVALGVPLVLTVSLAWSPSSAAHAAPVESGASFQADDLDEGSIGPRVERVQEALIRHGAFLPGGADGVFGTATTKAIADFQTWNGLTRTGDLDPATLRRLGLTSDSGGTSSDASGGSSSRHAELAPGSTGDAVLDVQRALLATGLVIRGGADGVFGDATERALKAFQRVNGLEPTGRMSERTARLLDPASAVAGAGDRTTPTSKSGSWTRLERFPVQGHCAFGDTWHAGRGSGRVHEGVDIIAATGKLVHAVSDGTITTQWWDAPELRAGNGLKLTAADGTYFVYLHLSGFAPGIRRGTEVKAGDVIGFVGNTGSSATPHLHFEIHPWGGAAINPYPYVRAIDACSDTRARYQSSFD